MRTGACGFAGGQAHAILARGSMNFASLKYKLIASFLCIGVALVLFMVIAVPGLTKQTAENVMIDEVKFIDNLLVDNLTVGMQTRDLDNGAALQQTLDLLIGGTVSSVAILDPKGNFVKGLNAGKAMFSKDTFDNKEKTLTVFRTMRDGDKKIQGFVEINFSKQSFIRSINRFKILIWLAGLFAVIAVIIVGVLLSNRIIMPLNRSVAMLKELASGSGDLSKRLLVTTNDEVGETAKWFNIFVEKIHGIIGKIAGSTSKLNVSSQDLSETAIQLSSGTADMTSKAGAVAGLTEKAVHNINNISSAADVMSGSVNTVAISIEEMSASLNEIADNCQKESRIAADANTQAKSTRELMARLGVSAVQIGKVVKAIKDIADQTNLLALNASIEAASAGEAGKGFSVVATAVKDLSKQTAKATDTITAQVQEIQGNTSNAVQAIEAITKIIEEISTTAQAIAAAVVQQNAAINEVARSVGSSSAEAANIARNVSESARGLSEVASHIKEVNSTARKTAQGVDKITYSSRQLTQLASDLQAIVQLFKM
jgi:methyl-accepting chemotaxis protein